MASVNVAQIERVAEILKNMPDSGHGINFCGFLGKDGQEIVADDMYPVFRHPQAINFFFFVCLHEFGFWYGDDRGYVEPLYGMIGGKRTKGSDLLWKACKRALDRDEIVFEPARLAEIKPGELATIFSDDNGPIPFPDFEERYKMTREYGRWFSENYMGITPPLTPSAIVRRANNSSLGLDSFLAMMMHVHGFNEDMLHKRQLLLAMVLANRPERFLIINDPDRWDPIVDYHLMRVSLRLGLVVPTVVEKWSLEERKWVSASIESDIRTKVKHAAEKLILLSGRPMSFVDEKLWMARKYCPEMEKPDCPKCVFYEVCEKHIELFQPVFRTTAY